MNSRAVSNWLFLCCGLVFLMVVVGAITRLTESGLSIVEWKPLMGAIPPLNDQEWQRVFELYQQSPEFQKKNFWMEIGDFKRIFFWEWLHRFLGRLIGLAYALPLLWFWITKQIPRGYKLKLLGILMLGGLQGLMGWYMVKSGLVDQPNVSHYRLTAHLLLAFIIIACMLWVGLSLREKEKPTGNKYLFLHGRFVFLFLFITIIWGAFTAGLDAGLVYNDSFPKMGGRWIPSEIFLLKPISRNFLINEVGVQFTHRWLAILTVLMIAGFWFHAYKRKNLFPALNALGLGVFMQAGLGILTLFTQLWLPIAALHQAMALILFMLLVATLHRLRI
jgi:heme a synthase